MDIKIGIGLGICVIIVALILSGTLKLPFSIVGASAGQMVAIAINPETGKLEYQPTGSFDEIELRVSYNPGTTADNSQFSLGIYVGSATPGTGYYPCGAEPEAYRSICSSLKDFQVKSTNMKATYFDAQKTVPLEVVSIENTYVVVKVEPGQTINPRSGRVELSGSIYLERPPECSANSDCSEITGYSVVCETGKCVYTPISKPPQTMNNDLWLILGVALFIIVVVGILYVIN